MLGVSSFYVYLMVIQEIHVFEQRIEMNLQCMILVVINATYIIKQYTTIPRRRGE